MTFSRITTAGFFLIAVVTGCSAQIDADDNDNGTEIEEAPLTNQRPTEITLPEQATAGTLPSTLDPALKAAVEEINAMVATVEKERWDGVRYVGWDEDNRTLVIPSNDQPRRADAKYVSAYRGQSTTSTEALLRLLDPPERDDKPESSRRGVPVVRE